MAEIYRQKVTDLAAALNAPETRGEAAEILRGLIDTIELRPSAEAYDILLRGDLAGILTLASNSKKPAALSRDGLSQMALVAGARNHLNLLFAAPRLRATSGAVDPAKSHPLLTFCPTVSS